VRLKIIAAINAIKKLIAWQPWWHPWATLWRWLHISI